MITLLVEIGMMFVMPAEAEAKTKSNLIKSETTYLYGNGKWDKTSKTKKQ